MQKVSLALLSFFWVTALIFNAVSVATPAWLILGSDSYGLWKVCSPDDCISLVLPEPDSVFYTITKVFALITTSILVAMVIYSLVVLFCNIPFTFAKGLSGSYVAAGICQIVALVVYTVYVALANSTDSPWKWGYSYILGWCSAILSIFLAIGACIIIAIFREDA